MNSDQSSSVRKVKWTFVLLLLVSVFGPNVMAANPGACAETNCRFVGKFAPGILPGVPAHQNKLFHIVEYDDGLWTYNGYEFASMGGDGWTPIIGDWDGDGYDEPGFHKDDMWFLGASWSGPWINGWIPLNFGPTTTSIPLAGDWNGDGIDTIGSYQDGLFVLARDHSNLQDTIVIDFGTVDPGPEAEVRGASPFVGPLDDGVGDRVGLVHGAHIQYAPDNSADTYDFLSFNDSRLTSGTLPEFDYKMVPVVIDMKEIGASYERSPRVGFIYYPRSEPANGSPCIADFDCYVITDPEVNPNGWPRRSLGGDDGRSEDDNGRPDRPTGEGVVVVPQNMPFN